MANLGLIGGSTTFNSSGTESSNTLFNARGASIEGAVTFNAATSDENIIINMGAINDDITSSKGKFILVNTADVDNLTTNFFSDEGPSDDEIATLLRGGVPSGAAKGTITGDVTGSSAEDTVLNMGTLTGNINLGNGDDYLANIGSIVGTVDLGGGDDTLLFGTGGSFSSDVDGGLGNNTLQLFGSASYNPSIFRNFGTIQFDEADSGEATEIVFTGTLPDSVTQLTVAENAVLDLTGGSLASNAFKTLDFDGTIRGNIALGSGGGNLTISSNSTLEQITVIDGGNSTVSELTLSKIGTLGASIQNFSSLTVSPPSGDKLTVTGDVTIAGDTTVTSGEFAVDGDLTADQLIVSSGATLSGTGTVTADTTIAGRHAPGASIGTQTVVGLYNPTGTVAIEVNGNGSDLIDVTGNVSIGSSAVLELSKETPSDTLGAQKTYQFINYTGSLTGAFSSVTFDGITGYSATVNYATPNVISVLLQRNSPGFASAANTANQLNVGAVFDNLVTTNNDTDLSRIADAAATLTPSQRRSAADSLSGEIGATVSQATAAAGQRFQSAIQQNGTRLAPASSNSRGFALSQILEERSSIDGDLNFTGDPVFAGSGDGRTGLWLGGLGGFGSVDDGDNGGSGYDYTTAGFATGVNFVWTDSIPSGIAFGYARSDIDGFRNNDTAEADSYYASVYARYEAANWQFSGTTGLAYHDYSHDRHVIVGGINRTASASYDGLEGSLAGDATYTYATEHNIMLKSRVGFSYALQNRDGFTEKGAGSANLQYDSETLHRGTVELTLDVAKEYRINEIYPASAFIRVGAVQEFGDIDGEATASFSGLSSNFTIEGTERDATSGLLGTGFNASINNNVDVFFDYNAKLNSSEENHLLFGGLRYKL